MIISENDVTGVYNGKETDSKIFLKYQDGLDKWMLTIPNFMWVYAFVDDITYSSFSIYNFTGSQDRIINVDPKTKKLLGCDNVTKFNRHN
jgi:hypothetical protein